ncbi:MAG: sensor histidine kinase [Chthoniobacterales bacterium]|nr:sensor histidine kinase [Chthoniobacterales bacterium]
MMEERSRIAREIHDTIAQALTGVIVQLQCADDALASNSRGDTRQHLQHAITLARGGLGDARRTVRALRPRELENENLCAAVETLIRRMTYGANLRASLIIKGSPKKLSDDWEASILRIIQEGLTNVIRHAHATEFVAELSYNRGTVRLALRDNGCGFNPAVTHDSFGLLGIRERVANMHGRVTINSELQRGTVTVVVLPLTDLQTWRIEDAI